MQYEDVKAMLEEADLPLAYDHFAEGESPDPPFLIFTNPAADNFAADDVVYATFDEFNVELYTDRKNPKLEKRLQKIFNEYDIYWNKTETYIESERLYEVLYELTL